MGMINYNLIHYLQGRANKRELDEKTRYCYITTKLIIKYEKYNGNYTINTLESLISKRLLFEYVDFRAELITKNKVEYTINMPVEMLPYFMEILYDLRLNDYPFVIERESIIHSYSWERMQDIISEPKTIEENEVGIK